MTKKTAQLLALADEFCTELSIHPVLSKYWDDISVILKGSTARGNTDRYSDVDIIVFCDESDFYAITAEYFELGLSPRPDSVFKPFGEWVGHYHIEKFDELPLYYSNSDYAQIWEHQNVIALHDPKERYQQMIALLSSDLLTDPLPAIRTEYVDLMLTLDWLRHPLKRGDTVSVMLHASKLVQSLCRMAYLLDQKPYPHDKWVFAYLKTTRFGRTNGHLIKNYASSITHCFEKHRDINEYQEYTLAQELIIKLVRFIRRHYGDQSWIDEWYLYF